MTLVVRLEDERGTAGRATLGRGVPLGMGGRVDGHRTGADGWMSSWLTGRQGVNERGAGACRVDAARSTLRLAASAQSSAISSDPDFRRDFMKCIVSDE